MANFIRHVRCPSCDKHNLGTYDDGGTYCFTQGCEEKSRGTGEVPEEFKSTRRSKSVPYEPTGFFSAIQDRRISIDTCKKYGVTVEVDKSGKVSKHHYPLQDANGATIGSQVKIVDPTTDYKNRRFYNTGDKEDRAEAQLFGQDKCRKGGKFITVTEGMLDTLAVAEMFDRKWDVVSINNGADSARRELSRQLEFLETYDHIVLCFDNDEAGQGAVDDVKDLFSPDKLKIASLPRKDASDMLVNKEVQQFTKQWWGAKEYTPAGIVKASETWDSVLAYRNTPSIPYPWQGLQDLLLGQRTAELNIWAAETGVGKSQTMREIIHHIIQSTDQQVGCLMLEESVAKSMLGWMSFHAGRPLHKDLKNVPEEELKKYWEMASAGDRFALLDHRGWQNSIDTLKARVRYMAKTLGCRTIILDHLHIALSTVSGATGDWSGIDELVTQLATLAEEADICLHVVSHVSEGRALRGSKGIGKLADSVIFLERDKHNEDIEVANTTTVVVDKNRFAGDVGTACYLRYSKSTGRMKECQKPENMLVTEEF